MRGVRALYERHGLTDAQVERLDRTFVLTADERALASVDKAGAQRTRARLRELLGEGPSPLALALAEREAAQRPGEVFTGRRARNARLAAGGRRRGD